MNQPPTSSYRHVQHALQTSNFLWDEQLFSDIPFRVSWSTGVIKALIVLGGAEISYVESALVNDDDGSSAEVWALTRGRVIHVASSVARREHGQITAETTSTSFARSTLQTLDLLGFDGEFTSDEMRLEHVSLMLHFPGRSITLGAEQERYGGATVTQNQKLVALLPDLLNDLEQQDR